MSLEEIHDASKIDPWFLAQLEDLVLSEKALKNKTLSGLKANEIFQLKRKGFSDARLAKLLDSSES
jgi:carbamoyl-phosphate synthase large subunit